MTNALSYQKVTPGDSHNSESPRGKAHFTLVTQVFEDGIVRGEVFDRCFFGNSSMQGMQFLACKFHACSFGTSKFSDCKFIGCELTGCGFDNGSWRDCFFKDCTLSGSFSKTMMEAVWENCPPLAGRISGDTKVFGPGFPGFRKTLVDEQIFAKLREKAKSRGARPRNS